MVIVLDNDELQSLLSVSEVLAAIRTAYAELGRGRAVNRPRTDMWVPGEGGDADSLQSAYVLKSFEGAVPALGVAALRLNSDVIHWSERAGGIRKDKIPSAPGGRYNGLVLLFDSGTGELLSIMPDGYLQGLRVAATTALAVEQLSRPDAAVVGLYGSGWQAEAALEMVRLVRPLADVRVFSPTPANRSAFAERVGARLDLPLRAVDQPRDAAAGAEIILAATNSVTPVVERGWVADGAHLSCVKYLELPPELIAAADPLVVNTRTHAPLNWIMGHHEMVAAHDPIFDGVDGPGGGDAGAPGDRLAPYAQAGLDFARLPELTEVMGGTAPGRTDPRQLSCFLNNIGLGIQFVAAAKVAYDHALAAGAGQRLPSEMFSQTFHP